jgi:phytanoyl-CoA dioxygenase PhyH
VRPPRIALSNQQQAMVRDLRRDGFTVIEDFWSRDKALETRDRLERYLQGGPRDFESGAYLRFQEDAEYDQGVQRLFHVDRLVPELADFRADRLVLTVIAAYYRMSFHSGVLLYQHNTKSNNNTRYYHVDSFTKEAKAFLYLDDVDERNGPFTYLRGSHRRHLVRLRKQVAGNTEGAPTSFHPEDLKGLLDHEVRICGRAGTLILADVRGLHRGSPQLDRSRSALVNYLHRRPGEYYPAR